MSVSPGKKFEADFFNSCKEQMFLYRLRDSPSSFNSACHKCKNQKIRFTPKNICDFVGYMRPDFYLLELKSTDKKSFPFVNIVKNGKDKRLKKMVVAEINNPGVFSVVILNFRSQDNLTYAVRAENVLKYIKNDSRKSIPFDWVKEYGIEIESTKKRTRYTYDINKYLNPF